MGQFLQLLGVLFLALILAVGLSLLGVWLRFRRMLKSLQKLSEGQMQGRGQRAWTAPPRVRLARMAAIDWIDAAAVDAMAKPLPELGFHEVGLFSAAEMQGLQLQAWVKPEESVTAVIYEHPMAGVSLDLFTHYQDGTRITYANTRFGSEVDHQPGHEVKRLPGLDAQRLYKRFLAERPSRPMKPALAADFVAVFEETYADEMDWRNSRGGATEAEIRSVAAALGQPTDDRIIEATRKAMQAQAMMDLQQSLRERFLNQTAMSANEWEKMRERVVYVHDRLTPEYLAAALTPHLEENEEEEPRLPFDPGGSSLRQAFAAWNNGLPEDRRFQKLGELDEPVKADVYCAPAAQSSDWQE